ncbi:hypothetical protein J7J58_04245 [candidate division WOR-3 bacterium]|nr:hypothetical protein [candidate division WOR-3 bacterium]
MRFIKDLAVLSVFVFIVSANISGNSFSELLINQDYSDYLKGVDTLRHRENLLLKAVYFTQYMIDYYNDQYDDSLVAIVKNADSIIPESDTDNFIKGGIYLNYAFYLQFKGNMWGALNYGNRGIKYLKDVSKDSPIYNDALIGVAIYDYGIGKLFFNRKKIVRGLEALDSVSKNGDYFDVVAKNLKIVLLYNENKYDEGLKEATDLLSKFPDSRLILWDVVKGFLYKKEYDSLITYSKKLVNNIKNDSIPNNYNLLTIYKWQIDAYIKLKRYDSARKVFDDIIKLDVENRYIRDVTKLKKNITNRYSAILK